MLKVDKDECIGCGFCFGNYTDEFIQGDDGLAEVNPNFNLDKASEKEKEEVDEAVDGCPVSAIKKNQD